MEEGGNQKVIKKTIFFVIRYLFLVVLGFLPSFLFIVLFIQYGSPLSNYIDFLSNLNESWIAWLSAFFIIFIGYAIGKIIKSRKDFKNRLKSKPRLFAFIFFLILIIALVSAQLYLYVNFLLGNDILIRLSSDKSDIFFTDKPYEEITFKISVTMNPFCVAQCQYEFFDIGQGKAIDFGMLNLTSVFSKSKTYPLNKTEVPFVSQSLGNFKIECKSEKTILCFTSEEKSKRSILITMNYGLSEEEKIMKNQTLDEIISLNQAIFSAKNLIDNSKKNLLNIDENFYLNLYENIENLSLIFDDLNSSLIWVSQLWEIERFDIVSEVIPSILNETELFYNQSKELNSTIASNISFYNRLAEILIDSTTRFESVSEGNMTDVSCNELNSLILDFNNASIMFKEEFDLERKENIVVDISSKINEFYNSFYQNEENNPCSIKYDIVLGNITKIFPVSGSKQISIISLREPPSLCCYLGSCEKCCDNCYNKDYPIIFLHGYSINRAFPADYSLDAFKDVKEGLIKRGYIDAGSFVINSVAEQNGLWGRLDVPVAITASYFFDTYKTSTGETTTVPSNKESIDTYATRLDNIIQLVKQRTNKEKVIIIAHSMGGVVTRRYLQVFGGEDVDKAILVTVPNHGIEGKIRDYCPISGSDIACKEMERDGVFMNNLNAQIQDIPLYNIIGIGCNMEKETGDGIVTNSSQYLDSAINYYVLGNCNELKFDFFHEDILNTDLYPETVDKIEEILS